MRKLFAFVLSISLLLGCLGLSLRAAPAGATEPFRVVSTFYDEGAQGFHWYTLEDCESVVVINGRTYTGSCKKFKDYYAHSVVADGLDPGTAYTYQIGDFTGTFRTDPGRGVPVSFIVNGDVQASAPDGFAYSARTVDAAWDKFQDAAFDVILGDFTNECDNERWDMYFDAFRGNHAKGTLVPIAGNHDGDGKLNWFRSMFTFREQRNFMNVSGVYYSFDYGDAHIAVLNSNDTYPMSMPQRNWLINDMKQTDAKWKIIFLHRGFYSAGAGARKIDVLLLRRALLPIIDDLGIDLVMYGHDHQYYRSEPVKGDMPVGAASQSGTARDMTYVDPKGTVYILPGAACDKRYGLNPLRLPCVSECAAVHEEPGMPMFTNISINGGTLTYKAYTYDPESGESEQYDTITLRKTSFSQPDPNYRPLRTDYVTTLPSYFMNLVPVLYGALVTDYIGNGFFRNWLEKQFGM